MNIPNYQQYIPSDFADDSKVWIYQSNRLFTISEALEIEALLNEFTGNWKSHGAPVKGFGNLLFGQFILLMADESATGVSGCSTDSSVHLIKKIESLCKVDLFNRQNLAFYHKEKVEVIPLTQLSYALDNNIITGDTIYFNNLVLTKQDFITKWMIPVKESWLQQKLKLTTQ